MTDIGATKRNLIMKNTIKGANKTKYWFHTKCKYMYEKSSGMINHTGHD